MKRISYILMIFVLVILCGSCRTGTRKGNGSSVSFYGRLDSIMMGYFPRNYNMDSLAGKENLYALGAMDSLNGEIQIFNSRPYHSKKKGDSVLVNTEATKNAALLVFSQVKEWENIDLPISVANTEALVGFMEYDDQFNELISDQPFVFLIDGVVEQMEWHVIDKPDSLINNYDHLQNAAKGSFSNTNVEIFGVYSRNHGGIFTHHNIPIHMHFRTMDGLLAGHIDEVELGPEMRLRIPKKK